MIIAEVRGQIPVDVETVFDVVVPIDLTAIMRGSGPLPAVAAIEEQSGDWDGIGQSRIIRLSDGSGMLETLMSFDRPHAFTYLITEITSPLRSLISTMHGSWHFEDAGVVGETPITSATWRYEFKSRSFLTRPLAWFIVKFFWRPYMAEALDRAAAIVVSRNASQQARATSR